MIKLKILVACEFSGTVREAFRSLGHEAWSCDILPSPDNSEYHIQEDIFTHLKNTTIKYDLMIAHPPCTYLSNSGVMWLHKQEDRWNKMKDGANFFKRLLEFPISFIAVENPIMHKYGIDIIGRKQDQVIQPFMFGHTEQKATCLWLKNLPPLKETNNVKKEMMELPKNQRQRLHYLPPSKDRALLRSITFKGIAEAMASQWSNFITNEIGAPNVRP